MCSRSWRTLWSEGQLRDAQSCVSFIVSEKFSDAPIDTWPLFVLAGPRQPTPLPSQKQARSILDGQNEPESLCRCPKGVRAASGGERGSLGEV